MSNVINSAFTTIRAATQPRPRTRFVYLGDGKWEQVTEIPTIIKNPHCSPWRHPIWWWKMRHLRHDVKVMSEAVDPEFKQKFDEELERKILHGTGEENN